MERVSEALQFPVIIEGSRAFPVESQLLEKVDFFLGRSPAQGSVVKEFF
jgi:hypothetical protein